MKTLCLWTAVLAASLVVPTVQAETLKLNNGDVINGTLVDENDDGYTIEHPALGEIVIPKDRVVAVYQTQDEYEAAEAAAKKQAAAAEKAAELEADEGIFWGSGFLAGWERRLEFGVTGSQGNSTNSNIRAGFFGNYEDEEDRWDLDILYRRADSEGNKTEDNFSTELTKDWLIPDEKYFYFANGKFESDRFQAWDQRLAGFLGTGYQFRDDGEWDVLGRVGAGGNQTFGSNDDEFTTEALLGIEAGYRFSDDHRVQFANTLYPSLEDAGEFRNITSLDWLITIDQDKGLALKLGVSNEHDSDVPAGLRKNDFKYYASLIWQF